MSRRKKQAKDVPRVREKRNVQSVVVRKQKGKGTIGRCSVRWEGTILIDLRNKMQQWGLD